MFTVPKSKQIRLIVDTDARCEADDAFAIVHDLLTPQFQVKGILAEHFGERQGVESSMLASYEECKTIVDILGLTNRVPVFKGAERAIRSETDYDYSEAAEFIYREAMKDGEPPLFITLQGAITNLACAYLRHPEIAGRITAVWVGGGVYPQGGWEFNMAADIKAANVILKSGIELWQIPINVYTRLRTSLTELEMKVGRQGKIGQYIFGEMVKFNDALADVLGWPMGECWSLGDSASVGVLLDPMAFYREQREAPVVQPDCTYRFTDSGRPITVYHGIDNRFILEDFFAKMKKYAEQNN